MNKLIVFVLLTFSVQAWAASYYLSATGSDGNNGTSAGAPWLTPDHAVNCGDTITAAASSSYSPANFQTFGTVTCPAGNNVAWLICATFDACKISGMTSSQNAMTVQTSYWGVQGWEADGSATSGPCFLMYPYASSIHHIIFANNIASGCGLNGIASSENSTYGVDYIAILGNITYNDAGGSSYCGSGISIYEPVASDTKPGTHIYIAGNFSWDNFNGNPCNVGTPSDGEGVIFDTWDGVQTGLSNYGQQGVIDNNILIANGGRGVETFNNSNGPGPFAKIYIRNNTIWGNNLDTRPTYAAFVCGETLIYEAFNIESFQNIVATSATNGCNGGTTPVYSFSVSSGNGTDHVYQDYIYAVGGTTQGITSSTGFSYGPNNIVGTSPSFSSAVAPGVPSCGSYASVPACMATVIANFMPTATLAKPYGYQTPSPISRYDPLFPQWLCNVNLPAGLVTPGCLTASASSGASISGSKIQ